jgi:hypothetical protein
MNFVVIGAKKAGTTFLYSQLRNLNSFWLPPFKETHYLLPMARSRVKVHFSDYIDSPEQLEGRDRIFATDYFFSKYPYNVANFLKLYAMSDGRMSGEIDPELFLMDKKIVAELAVSRPALKVVCLLRHPTERYFSHIKMVTNNSEDNTNDIIRKNFSKLKHQIYHSKYSMFFPYWENEFPAKNILYVSSRSLMENKLETVSKISKFIDPNSAEVKASELVENKKIGHTNFELNSTLRAELDNVFADDIEFMNQRLTVVD